MFVHVWACTDWGQHAGLKEVHPWLFYNKFSNRNHIHVISIQTESKCNASLLKYHIQLDSL